MALKEIKIKPISELPSHTKLELKRQIGDETFNRYYEADALIEIRVENSTPHIAGLELVKGTFSDRILNNVNGGKKIEDVFKY